MLDFLAKPIWTFCDGLDDAISFLGGDGIAVFIADIALVLIGFVAISVLVTWTVKRVRQIQQAVAAVELTKDEMEFFQNFDQLSNRIESLEIIRAPWVQFKSRLIFCNGTTADNAALQYAGTPGECFTLGAINDGWIAFRTLPSLFLSVTLAMTVVGVAGSIYTAMKAVSDGQLPVVAGQTVAIHDALRQLLSSGRASFGLALTGITVSLLVDATVRLCSARLASALDTFVDALKRRVKPISFEAVVSGRLASGSPLSASLPGSVDKMLAGARVANPVPGTSGALQEPMLSMPPPVPDMSRMVPVTKLTTPSRLPSNANSSGRVTEKPPLRLAVFGDLGQEIDADLRADGANKIEEASATPGSVSKAVVPSDLANESSTSGSFGADRLLLDLAMLRQSVEEGNERITSENRASIRDLMEVLAKQFDRSTVPHQWMSDAVSNISERLVRLEASVANPVNELAVVVTDLRQTLAATEIAASQAREHLAGCVGEVAQEVRLATDDMRDAVKVMTSQAQVETENVQRTLIEQIRQSVEEIGQAARHFEQNGSVIATRLTQVIDTAPVSLSRDAEAAARSVHTATEKFNALAEDFARRLDANPVNELAVVVTDLRQTLAATEIAASQAREHLAGCVGEVAQEVRLATDDMRDAVKVMTSQAQVETENVQRTLIEQIRQSVEEIGQAARHFEQNGSVIATRLTQVIDTAPVSLSRDAEAAARSVHTATEKFNALAEDFARRLDANPVNELAVVVTDLRQTLAATEIAASQAREHLAGCVGEVAQEVRLATDDMRDAVKVMTSQAQVETENVQRTLIEQIRQSVEEIGQAARHFEQNGSVIATRLTQVIDTAPVSLSRDAEAAARSVHTATEKFNALAEDFARRLDANPVNELAVVVTDLRQTLAATEIAASQAREHLAGCVGEVAQEVRLATDDMRDAVKVMTSQAQVETENVQRTLIEQIRQSVEEIGQAARHFEQNGSVIATRLTQVIDTAPVSLSRDAEAAARSVHTATEKFNALAEDFARRLDANPVNELAVVVTDLRQTLAATEIAASQAREHLAGCVGEVAQEVRLATDDMRDAVKVMTSQAQVETENVQRTLIEQIRQSVEEIGQAARHFEQNGSVIATRLTQVIDTAPVSLSRDAEAAARSVHTATEKFNALAEDFARRLDANPVNELAVVVTDLRQTLAATEIAASQAREHLAGCVGEVAQEVRLATDDMRDAVKVMTSQAQVETENVQRTLIEQIRQSVEEIGQAARHFEQNGSVIATRLTQVIDTAPVSLSRDAEAAARSVHTATEKFNALAEDFARRLDANPVNELAVVVTDLRQTLAATEIAASQAREHLAGCVGEVAQEVRLATDDMRDAVKVMTSQAQVETENVQRTLIEQMVSSIAEATSRESMQAMAVLTKITEQLGCQTADARDALSSQLASLVAIQALLVEMRQVRAAIADQHVNKKEFVSLLKSEGIDIPISASRRFFQDTGKPTDVVQVPFRASAEQTQPSSHLTSPATAFDHESVEAEINSFIAKLEHSKQRRHKEMHSEEQTANAGHAAGYPKSGA